MTPNKDWQSGGYNLYFNVLWSSAQCIHYTFFKVTFSLVFMLFACAFSDPNDHHGHATRINGKRTYVHTTRRKSDKMRFYSAGALRIIGSL